jgi:hypothetical protein
MWRQFEVLRQYDQFWIGVAWKFDERHSFLVVRLGFGIVGLGFSV